MLGPFLPQLSAVLCRTRVLSGDAMAEVFISYAREDRALVAQLHALLEAQKSEAWVDWDDIPPSVEWFEEIRAAILSAQVIVFVISPYSLASTVCMQELGHADKHGKRIIPVVVRETQEDLVPARLRRLNWIFCRNEEECARAAELVLLAVRTDFDWLHEHTRLLVRASEWLATGRERSGLLRGKDLLDAEAWMLRAPGKEPMPAALHTEYLGASRAASDKRAQLQLLLVSTALCVVVALALVAFVQRQQKEEQRHRAEERRREAVARQLTVESMEQARAGSFDSALLLAIEAMRTDAIDESTSERHATSQGALFLLLTLESQPGLIAFLHGHERPVTALAFDADGSRLASADDEGRVSLWNLGDLRSIAPEHSWSMSEKPSLRAPDPADAWVRRLRFDERSRALVALTNSAILRFDPPSWERREIRAADFVEGEAFFALDPQVRNVVSLVPATPASGQSRLIVRDATNARPQGKPIAAAYNVTDVALTPDRLVAIDWGGMISEWNPTTGTVVAENFGASDQSIEGEHENVFTFELSSKGDLSASTSGDHTVALVDLGQRKQVGNRLSTDEAAGALAFLAQDATLAFGGDRGTVSFFDVATHQAKGQKLRANVASCTALAASDARQLLAVGAADGTLTLWDLESPVPGRRVAGEAVAYSVTGRTIAVGDDGRVRLLDAGSLKATGELTTGAAQPPPQRKGLIDVLATSPRLLAGADSTGSVFVWDWVSHELVYTLPAEKKAATGLAFTLDGQELIATHGSTIVLWKLGDERPQSVPLPSDVSSVARLSPRGKWLAYVAKQDTDSAGFTLVIWNLVTKKVERRVALGEGEVRALAFSHDEQTLVVARSKRFSVLRTSSWTHSIIKLDEPELSAVAVSPDNQLLVAVVEDGIRLWDLASGRSLGRARTGAHGFAGVEFNPRGDELALVGGAGSREVLLWPFGADDLQQRGCAIAKRNLSCAEWRAYLGDAPYRKSCPGLPEPADASACR